MGCIVSLFSSELYIARQRFLLAVMAARAGGWRLLTTANRRDSD